MVIASVKKNKMFNSEEIRELKALLYKEIMNLERENNIERAVFFREMYDKVKGLTRPDGCGSLMRF